MLNFLAFLFWLFVSLPSAMGAPVLVLDLDGPVDPGSADYIVRGIRQAEERGAPAVLILVDTPGGLVESARDIVQAELNAKVPVLVHVGPPGARAGSAGVFITLAGHIASMAPGTNIGAAHPVSLFGPTLKKAASRGQEGEDPQEAAAQEEAMTQKMVNDTAAWARAIAQQRGRDVAWAEASVTQSVSITDQEALARGIIDYISADPRSLLDSVHGRVVELPSGPVALATRDVEFETLPMTLRQKVAHFLGNPNILFVLVALGALGIYAEFHNPGMVVPGIVGGIALLAAAVGLSMIPFNTGGLLLVLFGFVLFALEIWIPSYGALTIGGILSLVLGGILLFDVNEMDIGIDIGVLASVPLIAAAFALLAGWLVVRSHRAQVQTGPEGIVGEEGEVTRGGDGRGWVKVAGEIWKARWNGSLEAGDRVRVLEMYDLELRVERFEAGRPS